MKPYLVMPLLMNPRLKTGVAVAALALQAACGTTTRLDPVAPVEDRGAGARTLAPVTNGSDAAGGRSSANGTGGGTSMPVPDTRVVARDLTPSSGVNGAGNSGLPRTVYFEFNSTAIRASEQPVIEANARYLSQDRKRQLLVEGHTDDRGGSEYNLALGQRRAESVVKAVLLLGAQDSQLEATSYGKERPAANGVDEAAWAKNRRAELKDR